MPIHVHFWTSDFDYKVAQMT